MFLGWRILKLGSIFSACGLAGTIFSSGVSFAGVPALVSSGLEEGGFSAGVAAGFGLRLLKKGSIFSAWGLAGTILAGSGFSVLDFGFTAGVSLTGAFGQAAGAGSTDGGAVSRIAASVFLFSTCSASTLAGGGSALVSTGSWGGGFSAGVTSGLGWRILKLGSIFSAWGFAGTIFPAEGFSAPACGVTAGISGTGASGHTAGFGSAAGGGIFWIPTSVSFFSTFTGSGLKGDTGSDFVLDCRDLGAIGGGGGVVGFTGFTAFGVLGSTGSSYVPYLLLSRNPQPGQDVCDLSMSMPHWGQLDVPRLAGPVLGGGGILSGTAGFRIDREVLGIPLGGGEAISPAAACIPIKPHSGQ
jgi:hypothetical protein